MGFDGPTLGPEESEESKVSEEEGKYYYRTTDGDCYRSQSGGWEDTT